MWYGDIHGTWTAVELLTVSLQVVAEQSSESTVAVPVATTQVYLVHKYLFNICKQMSKAVFQYNYLWTQKLEFHIIFTCNEIYLWFFFFPTI